MKHVLVVIAALMLFNIGLYAFDPMYDNFEVIMFKKNTVRFSAWLDYSTATAYFDSDGTKQDFKTTNYDETVTCIRIPLNITYSISDAIEAGLLGQFVSNKDEVTVINTTTSYTGSGIGDTWLFAKLMLMPDPTLNVLLAGKLPTGTWKDAAEGKTTDLPTGDGQVDLELAINGRFPISRGNGDSPRDDDVIAAEYQIGFRYRMDKTYTYTTTIAGTTTTTDVTYTPGNALNYTLGGRILIAPGKFWGFVKIAGRFGVGDPSMTTTVGTVETKSTGDPASIMYIVPGFEAKLGVGFYASAYLQYPIMGKNTAADMNIIVGGIGMKFGH